MRVLQIHNHYRLRGGEGVVVEQEAALLRDAGHEVFTYYRDNTEAEALSGVDRIRLPQRMVWAGDAYADIQRMIRDVRPDVAHIHNTHFTISPAAVHACADEGIPVVMTLHNYRLICPAATLFRDGAVCEQCVGLPFAAPAVAHRCFRGSATGTAAVALTTSFHNYRGTWNRVSRFITPTAFARNKLIEGGMDPTRLVVKPHFLVPPPDVPLAEKERFMLFVGRLSAEKGALLLLRAWRKLADVPLVVVGDGPQMDEAQAMLRQYSNAPIELRGRVERAEVNDLMRRAYALVVPSECYETFGMVIVEAFAARTPVIAAGHGAPAELVQHDQTGLHFSPNDADDLAATVRQLWAAPSTAKEMQTRARQAFEAHYTPEQNIERLMSIYHQSINERDSHA